MITETRTEPAARGERHQFPRRILAAPEARDIHREWLVTNGLGGYASGAVKGIPSRRYHGYLVAALPPPHGRTILLNHLSERVFISADDAITLSDDEWSEVLIDERVKSEHLMEFRLVAGLPHWTYRIHDIVLEKKIFMPYGQNTVHVVYKVLRAPSRIRLRLNPFFHHRHHEAPVDPNFLRTYRVLAEAGRYEIVGSDPHLLTRVRLDGPFATFMLDTGKFHEVFYPVEKARGYASSDRLWRPGTFSWKLEEGETATLTVSAEDWATLLERGPAEVERAELDRRQELLARAGGPPDPFERELVLAADAFVVTPAYRSDLARKAPARSVIAGYHWFTDWGRDTMISLEGLTLCTGQPREAARILETFAHHIRDGLIPNMFPDGGHEGLYHTADATLWYFQAIERYLARTGDRALLRRLLPLLENIVGHHLAGTKFGIHVDPADGLLHQGALGYQLTWMDAKVGDWVVTPRRGKAVEINALWYNALALLAHWLDEEESPRALEIRDRAEHAQRSFNERFWNAQTGGLFDIVDGEAGQDPAIRPNQLFALSLAHPVLARDKWESVFGLVTRELLTPVGLRSLSRRHPDYKPKYHGDLRARDAAYHQGTVWAWLIGAYIDAYLKLHPRDKKGARAFLEHFNAHLSEAGIGSISEVFDAEAPYTARGCTAQAWSIAEVLRCWQKTR